MFDKLKENKMKQSELRKIIREEIANAGVDMSRFKEKVGFKEPNPSIKNTMKETEYKVSYWYKKGGEDYDDVITVKASSPEEAIAKAKKVAERNSTSSSFKIVK